MTRRLATLALLAAACTRAPTPDATSHDATAPIATRDTLALDRPILLGYHIVPDVVDEAAVSVGEDFGVYLGQAMAAFQAHGAAVHVVTDTAVNLRRADGSLVPLHVRQSDSLATGYWLLRPGAAPVPLGEGVKLDTELVVQAGELLGWPEGAAAPVERFYGAYVAHGIAGAPGAAQLDSLAPHLSDTLRALLAAARRLRDEEARRAPDDKPPFADGDLFSSLFEGPTGFAVGAVDTTARPYRVPVALAYRADGQATEWTDTARVVRRGDRFVVDDIAFGGRWDFANKGTLRTMLERALR